MNKLVILAAGLILGLSACGTADIDSEAVQTVAGQVAGYDGPVGVLEATTGVIRLSEAGTGSIEADGTFTFALNQAPAEFVVSPIAPPGCAEVDVSDAAARALNVAQFSVTTDGLMAGTLSQSQDVAEGYKGLPLPDRLISRVYADRDVTAKGTCTLSILGTQIVTTYDVTYQRGWNTTFTQTTFSADGLTANSKVSAATPSDVNDIAWRY